MALILFWLVVTTALGHAALPLSRRIFPNLPDGGLAAGRVLLIVLMTLLAFELSILHLVSLQLAPIFFVIAPILLWWRCARHDEFRQWKRDNRRNLWISDAVFLLAYCAFLWIRLRYPVVSDMEKPMDAALMGSAARADWLPFSNPWLAGVPFTNYYYFGPLMGGTLARTLATPTYLAYNLVQPLFCALFISTLTALCAAVTRSWWRGAWAMAIVALCGHFEPLRQASEGGFSPLSPSALDWWKTSRVIENTINEYPAFTMILGDAHAHFYALSLAALFFSLCWALFDTPTPKQIAPTEIVGADEADEAQLSKSQRKKLRRQREITEKDKENNVAVRETPENAAASTCSVNLWPRRAILALISVILGIFVITNTWDAPLYGLLGIGAALLTWRRKDEGIVGGFLWIGAMFCLGPYLALPYLRTFNSPVQGLVRELWQPPQTSWLLLWGGIFGLWLLGAVFLIACWPRTKNERDADEFPRFWLLLSLCGMLALLAPTRFYIQGFFGDELRHQDTVFKFGVQAWLLLGTAGACGAWWLLQRLSRGLQVLAAALWLMIWLVPVSCSSSAVWNRAFTTNSTGALSLNGAQYLSADDQAAIQWLNQNARADSVVLEAVTPQFSYNSYTEYGRVTTLTGIPDMLGWTQHDYYWGADNNRDLVPRHLAAQAIYTRPELAADLLRQWKISSIFIGDLERRTYTQAQLQQLISSNRVVFQSGATIVLAPR